MKLSLLCVTRGENHARRFLTHFAHVADLLRAEYVIGCDRCNIECSTAKIVRLDASSCPTVETVLEEAVGACSGDWILRMDDDETLSLAMLGYMLAEDWSKLECIAFPRAHLYVDEHHAIADPQWWPDWTMRLSPREYAVRHKLHEPAKKVTHLARAMMLHHNLLVRGREGRREVAERYCQILGTEMDDSYWPESPKVFEVGDGFA